MNSLIYRERSRLVSASFRGDFFVFFRLEIFHRQILEFGFDIVQTHAVCQWGKNINRFRSDFQLFFALHAVQRAHIVQAVCQFDQDHPGIISKREQYLLEIFCLLGSININNIGNFRESVNNTGDFASKIPFNIFQGNIRIFHHIM